MIICTFRAPMCRCAGMSSSTNGWAPGDFNALSSWTQVTHKAVLQHNSTKHQHSPADERRLRTNLVSFRRVQLIRFKVRLLFKSVLLPFLENQNRIWSGLASLGTETQVVPTQYSDFKLRKFKPFKIQSLTLIDFLKRRRLKLKVGMRARITNGQ